MFLPAAVGGSAGAQQTLRSAAGPALRLGHRLILFPDALRQLGHAGRVEVARWPLRFGPVAVPGCRDTQCQVPPARPHSSAGERPGTAAVEQLPAPGAVSSP